MNFNGIVLLNKPAGVTSRYCVNRVVKVFNNKKVGHSGTLDPGATGMLPICVGQATKFVRFLIAEDKQYTVTMRLGVKTHTADIAGEVIARQAITPFSRDELLEVLADFVGVIKQQVPLVSAVRVAGKRLYKYALESQPVELPIREVVIKSLELLDFGVDFIQLKVGCSKGTYIRSLVEDIGNRLGNLACVATLHRDWVEPFFRLDTVNLVDLESGGNCVEQMVGVLTLDQAFSVYSCLNISQQDLIDLLHGKLVEIELVSQVVDVWYALYCVDKFCGIGQIDFTGEGRVVLKSLRLLSGLVGL